MKSTLLIKTYLYFLLLLLASCATRVKVDSHVPEWYSQLEESEDDAGFLIKIAEVSPSEEATLDAAVEELYLRIMEHSGRGSLYSEKADQDLLKQAIRNVLQENESTIDGFLSVQKQEWISLDKVYYYGALYLKKSAGKELYDRIVQAYYEDDEILQALLAASLLYESEMKYYSSAEELIKAALHVKSLSEPLADDLSQGYIDRAGLLLRKIKLRSLNSPNSVLSNQKISDPFHIFCTTDDEQGIADVEFLVRYQGRKRDGVQGEFERRLVSNVSGIMEFYHPFIPFSGTADVQFEPGSRDFHAGLLNLEKAGLDVSSLRQWLEESTINYELNVASGARTVSMGIVLLHTDSTGSALNQEDSSVSLQETLSQDGYNTSLMNLNPREISKKSEDEFIRDLRALYKGKYTRVVFGIVGIRDFESRNDSYRVKTSGSIKVVDVDSGEVLLTLELDKSVESRSNTVAVSASFQELGKAFAEEVKRSLE
ncbi:hypothetical protein [Oceanispirochaeta sp.]|uniref:hypothetical protein n=1 Tax=Oceanispirochaeta sp. TaxID=2035350 RepID=UPI00263053C2|nr:hypothetical protein [Oceanispirochaeta sp.]MDA3958766.1 hypothetical protein [Oceanispirochaeta sp.]